jgi:hypothetical protein
VTALSPSHGANTDVLVNGNVVSQYFNSFGLSPTRDKAETSAFKQLFKSYVAGMIDAVATISGLYDASNVTAEDPLLYSYLTAITAADNQWFYAPNGAQGSSAQGNAAWAIGGISTKYEIKSDIKSANSITAEVQMDSTSGGLDRGIILSPWATQSAAGNSASSDFGSVSSANGGVLLVHAFSDAASLVVNLQDSADNSTFANVTGYTVSPTNSTIAAYRFPAAGTTPTGTIRRYTRVSWTGTGTFLAFFSRK